MDGKVELFLVAAISTLIVIWVWDYVAPKVGLPSVG
jgi:hypothetical protein